MVASSTAVRRHPCGLLRHRLEASRDRRAPKATRSAPGRGVDGVPQVHPRPLHAGAQRRHAAPELGAALGLGWQDALVAVLQGRVHQVSSYDVEVRSASHSFRIPSVICSRSTTSATASPSRATTCSCATVSAANIATSARRAPTSPSTTWSRASKGGTTCWTNIVTCCAKHNLQKADKTLKQSGLSLRRMPFEPTPDPARPASPGGSPSPTTCTTLGSTISIGTRRWSPDRGTPPVAKPSRPRRGRAVARRPRRRTRGRRSATGSRLSAGVSF